MRSWTVSEARQRRRNHPQTENAILIVKKILFQLGAEISLGVVHHEDQHMVLRGVTSEGKILVADPASKKRSEQEWDISIILDEARKGAAAGGPLWAIY